MRSKLKTFIIDYSETQRRLICYLANKNSHLELIGSFNNAFTAVPLIQSTPPDLLIIDLDTPDIDGSEFLKRLPKCTQVILVTANADYALMAFDLGVTDYLLKPLLAARFQVAIRKVWSARDTSTAIDNSAPSLQIKSDHEIKTIALSDIRWVEALGDYVKIVTRTERFLILSTMKSIEEALPRDKFLRIHRSYIVNLNKVENFSSTNVEIEGKELPMSRKQKTKLEEILLPYE